VIGSPQCAFCREDVYTRSGWRVGQNWFCSQSCFQKYEAWRSGRSQIAPQPLSAAPRSTRPSPERPKRVGLRLRTILIPAAIVGALALLLWFTPSLHSGKSVNKAANAANGALALPRQTPKLDSAWLLRAINGQRRHAGLQPLSADRAASLLAQQQSVRMAAAGKMLVISGRDLRPFRYAGDVAQTEFSFEGGSIPFTRSEVFAEMMKKGTRRDVLGRYNRVGIGVTRRPPNLWLALILIRA
jgi:Cysteine-rich secretory protein family